MGLAAKVNIQICLIVRLTCTMRPIGRKVGTDLNVRN